MLLAFDTATPFVTVALHDGESVVAEARSEVRMKHGEHLAPLIEAVLRDAGVVRQDLTALAVGTGPGPFTGLRVGLVTARTLAMVLEIPAYGVCSLDAIANGLGAVLVVTDARRREVYWAAYGEDGRRTQGPHVDAPAVLLERMPHVRAAAGGSAEVTGLPVVGPSAPTPAGLVAVAAPALRAGVVPGPLEPLYLRRPDAQEPGARKRVTA